MHKDMCMMAITMVWWESLWGFPKSCSLKPAPVAMVADRKTKSAITPPQGEFQHQSYWFGSAHKGNHGGVVRILVGLLGFSY